MDKKHKYMADMPDEDERDIYPGPETIDDTELYITISKSLVDDNFSIKRNLIEAHTGEILYVGHQLIRDGEHMTSGTTGKWFEEMHQRSWEAWAKHQNKKLPL